MADNTPVTKADLEALEERLLERIEKIETNILRAFNSIPLASTTHLRAELPQATS